jgi:ATP-binding cassette, subfamily C, bacterial PrsD
MGPVGEGGEAAVGRAAPAHRTGMATPFLVVLDEPNSNLDSEGEVALHQEVIGLKARGAIVVLIAHRPTTLSACDRLLVLANGVQQGLGPRDEILGKLVARRVPPAAVTGNLKVVSDTTSAGKS